jgi:molecular chaperone GrpE
MKHPERDDPTTPEQVETSSEAAAGEAPEQSEPDAGPASSEAELAAELADTKDRLLRALAEVENLRRRSARELDEARKYAVSGFARELLEVDDNLSRALASIPEGAGEEVGFVKTLGEGVAMTQRSLAACFERHRIAKVTPQLGEKFDHNRHQAMLEVESDQPPGTIAQVLQPGYVIADRLLRPALVGVAKAPGAQAAEPEALDLPGERVDRTA